MADASIPVERTAVALEALRDFIQKRPYDLLNGIPAPPEIADDGKCGEILRQVRWADGVTCPGCGQGHSVHGTVHETGADGVLTTYRCSRCGLAFNDLSGTLFSLLGDRNWPLTRWFYGIWLMAHGLTKHEIWPLWGMHYGTVDFIARQVRHSPVGSAIMQRLALLAAPAPPEEKKHEVRERPIRAAERGAAEVKPALEKPAPEAPSQADATVEPVPPVTRRRTARAKSAAKQTVTEAPNEAPAAEPTPPLPRRRTAKAKPAPEQPAVEAPPVEPTSPVSHRRTAKAKSAAEQTVTEAPNEAPAAEPTSPVSRRRATAKAKKEAKPEGKSTEQV